MAVNRTENLELLRRYFPEMADFRDVQEDAIDRVVTGKSTLCLMPTGAGKSLIYQIAGLRSGKLTIVISPLIALMQQQADRLAAQGIAAISLGGMDTSTAYGALRELASRPPSGFLFLSPERLEFDGYLSFVLRRLKDRTGPIVIDEAHCVSQWGHSFRPSYKGIPRFLSDIFGDEPWPTRLCLTATLGEREQAEVRKDFRIGADATVRSPALLRKNLALRFESHADETAKVERLRQILAEHAGQKAIIYVHRKRGEKGTALLAERFRGEGLNCEHYDADLGDEERRAVLTRFESGATKVVFATSAFGMGIDIRDIRVVVHYLLPESIEQYYQEVGRAGRDGEPAFGVLLYSKTNVKVRRDMIRRSVASADEIRRAYDKLVPDPPKPLYSIDPATTLSDDGSDAIVWNALQELGILRAVAKGPAKVGAFAVPAKVSLPQFATYASAKVSRTGLVAMVARNTGTPLRRIVDDLYQWYTAGQLRIERAPTKSIYFERLRALRDDDVEAIAAEQKERMDYRLNGFDDLVTVVETGMNPAAAIAARLAVERK